jgi:phosphoribosyl 1,2-cyclic phosphodiesterase
VFTSGSKGNCAYLETAHSRVLIDCGIGIRELETRLAELGTNIREIDAVLITHLHTDHTRGLPLILKRTPARVYAHGRLAGTLEQRVMAELAVARHAAFRAAEFVPFEFNGGFYHRDLDILPVPVSHDCDPTAMYTLHHHGRWLGVLTDLGEAPPEVGRAFRQCDLLLLESNHDPELLRTGPYPERLRRRVAGNRGHLSNRQAAEFATGLSRMPEHLLLGHLSDTNNRPELASAEFRRVEWGSIPHTVIPQRTAGPLVEL